MPDQPVDYDALAGRHGGAAGKEAIDYDAIARQHGGAPVLLAGPDRPRDKPELPPGMMDPVADFVGGVFSGGASTMFHGGDLIRRAVGAKRIIDTPEVQQAMSAPDSWSGGAGKFAEQAAEFLVPGSAVSKLTKGAGVLVRMGAHGLATGGVAGMQTGGEPEAVTIGALAGAAGPALGAGARAVGRSRITQKLYQSALKPTWAMAKKEGLGVLETGLKEEIPVSAKGLEIAEKKIDNLRSAISAGVQSRAALGATVDTSKVLSAMDDLEDFYRNTAAPKEALDTLQGIRQEFQAYHGQRIPLDQAQRIKINTYQELKKSYGEMKTAKIEGLKQVARGLKEQISAVFPEIADLNEQQSKLLNLDDALYRAVWRIENHQMMGIGSPLAATAGHAVMGGPGAVVGLVGKFLLDDPTLKSKLAIALARVGNRTPATTVGIRLAALKASIAKAASSLGESPEQPSAQPQSALAQ